MSRVGQDREHRKGFANLIHPLHTFAERVPAPFQGTVSLPKYDYAANAEAFREKTYNLHAEVVTALGNVHGECNKILDLRLFATDLKKPMTLQEFVTAQQDAYKYAAQVPLACDDARFPHSCCCFLSASQPPRPACCHMCAALTTR